MPELTHFLYKLIAPRPSFHLDMTDDEKQAMGLHMQYWASLTEQRSPFCTGLSLIRPVYGDLPSLKWGMKWKHKR